MPIYRKKPVKIEARRFGTDAQNVKELLDWMGPENAAIMNESTDRPDEMLVTLHINTLEGTMIARPGDFIIKGVQGEFYPCKEGIFRETYEEV